MYARSGQSWQSIPSPPLLSPTNDHRSKTRNHSNESLHKSKREINISPIHTSSPTSINDLSTPLNISIKRDSIEENPILITNKSKSLKQQVSTITTRRQHMLCKKKVPQNGLRRRQCMNSVENQGKINQNFTTLCFNSNKKNGRMQLNYPRIIELLIIYCRQ